MRNANLFTVALVLAVAFIVTPGCASIPQAQLDSILHDIQGCKRQYILSTGGGAGLPAAQFSANINCEPTVLPPNAAPVPAPTPQPAQP